MNAYTILHTIFMPAGLTITDCRWSAKEDGTFSFHAALRSIQDEKLTRINGAVYSSFTATAEADSPEKAVQQLYEMAISEEIWLGTYDDYHSVMEWDAEHSRFTTRPLSKEEDLRVNCIL